MRIRLRPKAESALKRGHPWVFSDSISAQNREGVAGEFAIIFDRQDRFMALGLFDPGSPIRVRVLHLGKPTQIDETWWEKRLAEALAKRAPLFGESTNGGRWIHGENDGFPGLVLDRYADSCVLKLYSRAWFPHLEMIQRLIHKTLQPNHLVLRLSRNIQAGAPVADGTVIQGAPITAPVVFKENGLLFEAEVLKGQKTGFFLDQRENRKEVGDLAAGRDVLNCFSFSGGFSLYAARGKARSVTDVDISAHALASAERNFRLNDAVPQVRDCPREAVQANVFDWLKGAGKGRYGLIILDPPSLAKREAERLSALEAYASMAERGFELLRPGGILVAASCSAHVSTTEFYGAIRGVAARAKGRELLTTGHQMDHRATFREAEYLKTIYFEKAL